MTVNHPSLSKRELEILQLLAQDFSDREIADHLVVAHTTVKWFNRQIYNKLGVDNRQQAVQRAIALRLLKDQVSATAPARSLPAPLTPFIGRIPELDDLTRLLFATTTRLVTILAPGGMGKTRLALASAQLVLTEFPDGVFFVPLTPLTLREQIAPTMADAIGLQLAPDGRSPQQQILDFFRFKRALVLLDNVEHLLDGVSFIIDLLSAAPGLKVLATSRERLNLHGETVYPLSGMPYPASDADNTRDYGAVQLFIACAQRASARFVADQMAEIVHICQLVQGMPLALELAAAWVGVLSPREIADEIKRSADFLHTTIQNIPERLRSVRAVFEAAWRRLTPDEQRVFARLSVFRGGFTREAAGAVAGASVGVLASLVDKALLWRQAERYNIHELLRQYAESELSKAGEAEKARDAHREYFRVFANRWAQALKTPQHMNALEHLDAEIENIRIAFWHAIDLGQPEALEPFGDLWYYYHIRGWWLEGEAIFGAALARLEPHESVALARMIAAYMVCVHGLERYARLLELAQRSADMLSRFGAEQGNLLPFWYVGLAQSIPGNYDRSMAVYHDVLERARAYNDLWATGIVLFLLGQDAFNLRQHTRAKAYLAESLTTLTALGNEWGVPYPLYLLGRLALLEQDYETATRLFEQGITHSRNTRHPLILEECLLGLVFVAVANRDLDLARQLAEDVFDLRRDSGRPLSMLEAKVTLAEVAKLAGNVHEARGHLREALVYTAEVMAIYLLPTFLIAAELLLHLGKPEQAVELISLTQNHPDHESLILLEPGKPQQLVVQLRAVLPPDLYEAAWVRGANMTPEEARVMLATLL